MATEGFINQHFVCHLTMVEQIKCAHSISFKAPGLVIDKAGTVAETLSYSFPANDGLTPQDIGIIGSTPGTFYLFADITSPYFVSATGLKVRKDKIKIVIGDAQHDGWYGDTYGLRWGTAISTYWSEPDKYYIYNHAGGSVNLLLESPTDGPSIGAKFYGPSGLIEAKDNTTTTLLFTATAPGQYKVEIYGEPVFANRQSQAVLGNATYRISINGGSYLPTTAKRRGIIWQEPNLVHGPAYSSFTQAFADQVESYRPGSAAIVIGYVTPYGFVGTVTGGSGALTAVGYWTSGYWGVVVGRSIAKPQGGAYSVLNVLYNDQS